MSGKRSKSTSVLRRPFPSGSTPFCRNGIKSKSATQWGVGTKRVKSHDFSCTESRKKRRMTCGARACRRAADEMCGCWPLATICSCQKVKKGQNRAHNEVRIALMRSFPPLFKNRLSVAYGRCHWARRMGTRHTKHRRRRGAALWRIKKIRFTSKSGARAVCMFCTKTRMRM